MAPVAGSTEVVPWAGADITKTEAGLRLPSGSVSFATTSTVTGTSSSVVPVSSAAVGASFTPVTERSTVAVAQSTGLPPSQTW